MSKYDALIDHLVAKHKPVSRTQVAIKIGIATIIAACLVLALVFVSGLRTDLALAITETLFWAKIAYGTSIFAIALSAVSFLARPDSTPPTWLKLTAIPVIVIVTLAMAQTIQAAPNEINQFWLGETALVCPALISGLSIPGSIALTLVVRRCAPTHLRATGAVIGLAAGGMATALYALHCPESGYGFVLVWYTMGIALAVVLGAIFGPRALRW